MPTVRAKLKKLKSTGTVDKNMLGRGPKLISVREANKSPDLPSDATSMLTDYLEAMPGKKTFPVI